MIVDDDEGWRTLVDLEVRNHGCDTILAASVADAIEALEQRNVDVILSDYSMPGRTGLNLLSYVRTRLLDLTFVLTSSALPDASARAAAAAGATALGKTELIAAL
jgi:CheY-like chemotaxis protein